MRFQVQAMNMKMAVFCNVASCSLVDTERRFRSAYCLHHQGDEPFTGPHGATSQETAIFRTAGCLLLTLLTVLENAEEKYRKVFSGPTSQHYIGGGRLRPVRC
jgi:hypothetical protein